MVEKAIPWHQYVLPFSCLHTAHTRDQEFWNCRLQPILSRMLSASGSSLTETESQLDFFSQCVSPYLGKRPPRFGIRHPSWHSFMTDDGTPIELSWSWSENDTDMEMLPAVRYSIEPLANRSKRDTPSSNVYGNEVFLQKASVCCTDVDMSWYQLLSDVLIQKEQSFPKGRSSTGERESQIFWAFDLQGSQRLLKVYYVLNARAESMECSKLDLLMQAVSKLSLDSSMLAALENFRSFVESSPDDLEIEMLGFDCIDPMKSRIKIYFRSRKTCFDEVCRIMSLGGKSNFVDRGALQPLKQLWYSVLSLDPGMPTSRSLPEKNHRTAGILYYYELRPGSTSVKTKVYIPVRHYGINDHKIAEGLSGFLKSRNTKLKNCDYIEILKKTWPRRSLEKGLGLHTYVTCAISKAGKLNVTTYFNPELFRTARSWRKKPFSV
ncbi:aromatic prenyltransferase [Delitschia confertaspora ATCC 74209]|uniref:Aromatic prenyltransferase n=1 Tax=Delitschia confertaspora ATCC 74209 TaxID=1513339 RepID=A0A9P4MZ03_9PLEO|nr:aromatic prenyltransferase [Delitschia confertaspora ATCC 74209]